MHRVLSLFGAGKSKSGGGAAPKPSARSTAPTLLVEESDTVDEAFPWLVGALESCDRYGSLVMHNRTLTRVVVALGLALVVSAACNAYQATHRQFIPPIVVQVDKTGFMVPIKVADTQSRLNATEMLGITGRWVRALRTVMKTSDGQMELVDQVYAHLIPGSPAAQKVSEWYRKDNPLVSAGKRTVEVEILRMYSGRSAQEVTIEWRERSQVMNAVEAKLYSAFISLEYAAPPPETEQKYLIINPVGLYVADVQISTLGEEHDRP